MVEYSEEELITWFVEDIDTYPFKSHIKHEVECKSGRVDLVLPDYNILIEAKAGGSIKSAIGQALCYSEVFEESVAYILVPVRKITEWVLSACERADIGILTTTRDSLNFSIVHDVGGFESFHPHERENVEESPRDLSGFGKHQVVGGSS